ncbi:hypothetical protein [Telmatospirillum siberiense]|uniref:PAS domain-containing protein n=1 Tax=Telmatospirillum siberiense TaxID=382514 RepID=A0A2N3PQY7_9PROT|nr:hypothetical protein [Telmatospirillum siberiense]PKU22804.1 hypothetical protein CWS72_19300 [Telmatospirillum siberiense]
MNETPYVQAFDLMWETFPEPTLLVRKDRTVIAANASARRMGRTEGGKCFGVTPFGGGKNHCRNCKADLTLRSREAISEVSLDLGAPITSYWLPLPDSTELYVHFGFGVAELLRNQGAAAAPQSQG